MFNPMLMGVSSAARALEALVAGRQSSPASSSAGAFSTGQGLPAGSAAGPQPSRASSRFAPAMLGALTALQDPSSAAAGFASGAETAVGQGVHGVGALLGKLKDAAAAGATAPDPGVAASARATGSAAAGALSTAADSALLALVGGHNHLHRVLGGAATGSGSTASAAGALSLGGSAPTV